MEWNILHLYERLSEAEEDAMKQVLGPAFNIVDQETLIGGVFRNPDQSLTTEGLPAWLQPFRNKWESPTYFGADTCVRFGLMVRPGERPWLFVRENLSKSDEERIKEKAVLVSETKRCAIWPSWRYGDFIPGQIKESESQEQTKVSELIPETGAGSWF